MAGDEVVFTVDGNELLKRLSAIEVSLATLVANTSRNTLDVGSNTREIGLLGQKQALLKGQVYGGSFVISGIVGFFTNMFTHRGK